MSFTGFGKEVKGLKRLRISSIEASQLTDEVIEVLANSKVIVRHMHVPLQWIKFRFETDEA